MKELTQFEIQAVAGGFTGLEIILGSSIIGSGAGALIGGFMCIAPGDYGFIGAFIGAGFGAPMGFAIGGLAAATYVWLVKSDLAAKR